MLSVPTLWTVFVVNFLALGLVWTYVMRSYPKFDAAKYWAAGTFIAAFAAALSMLRGIVDNLVPLLIGGGMLIFAVCLCYMGVQRFYHQAASWRLTAAVTGLSVAGLSFFLYVIDDMAMRICIYSLGQSVPIAMTLKLVMTGAKRRTMPGTRLTAIISMLILATNAVRSGGALVNAGGEVSIVNFNTFHATLVLILVFLSMTLNFGFLLMAIDRLRGEVADLAMLDDLTGIANRRLLLQRLAEECAISQRTGEPFALLAIDLDGFKAINDTLGHAAGDECLKDFTRLVQGCLRPGDLLARSGGDEFSIVLPATTLREGAMIARRVLEACRANADLTGSALSASLGVAQWTPQIGMHPERLSASADQALYVAKKDGKGRHAVYDHAPAQQAEPPPLRRSA